MRKAQQQKMKNFIKDRLDASENVCILQEMPFGLVVRNEASWQEPINLTYVVIHTHKWTKSQVRDIIAQGKKASLGALDQYLDAINMQEWDREPELEYQSKVMQVAHILPKDDKSYHVRLSFGGFGRKEKSLKNYSHKEREAMLNLRDVEKRVIASTGSMLVYYQPETANLEESLRVFSMRDVELDYSHLEDGDHGYSFARDGISENYKIPVELKPLNVKDGQEAGVYLNRLDRAVIVNEKTAEFNKLLTRF